MQSLSANKMDISTFIWSRLFWLINSRVSYPDFLYPPPRTAHKIGDVPSKIYNPFFLPGFFPYISSHIFKLFSKTGIGFNLSAWIRYL